MSHVEKLYEHYRNVLSLLDINPDELGLLSVNAKKKIPVMVEGKVLALPYNELLRSENSQEYVFFNPLAEDIRFGESVVIQRLRGLVNVNLNLRFTQLVTNLFQALEDPSRHEDFNKAQTKFMHQIAEIDPTTTLNFSKISSSAVRKNFNDAFINIFLNRGTEIHGKKMARAGVFTLKFLKELENCGDSPFGSKVRRRDVESFKTITTAIFPLYESDRDSYSCGTNSKIAPYYTALLGSFIKVTKVFNAHYKLFKNFIPDWESYIVDTSLIEESLDSISDYLPALRSLPVTEANSGNPSVTNKPTHISIDESAINTPVVSAMTSVREATTVAPNVYQPIPAQVNQYQQNAPSQATMTQAERLRMVTGSHAGNQFGYAAPTQRINRTLESMRIDNVPFSGPYVNVQNTLLY